MSFFRFFIVFLVFGAFHFPLSNSFFKKKSVKLVLFSALAPRSSFRAGFGQEKLQSCQGTSIGFCKLVLANSIGVAASQLLCVAVAQVLGCERSIALVAVSSFATRLLANSIGVAAPPLLYVSFANRMGMVAPKLRRVVFDEMFLAFGAFHFPSKLTRNPQILLFVWLWRRDIVLEQVLAQRRAEMI